MSELLRREIPLGLSTFIVAFIFFDYYIFTEVTRSFASIIKDWAIIVTATAAGVGVMNILIRTYHKIVKREQYWLFDIWMVIMTVIVGVTGLIGVYGTNSTYEWIIMNMYLPIDGTIYSMVFFDIISAYYRTFRIRSHDSVILFVCAFLIMLKNAPITGGLIPSYLPIADWVLNVLSTAGARSFTIVASIGIIAFTIRTMLWQERGSIGVTE